MYQFTYSKVSTMNPAQHQIEQKMLNKKYQMEPFVTFRIIMFRTQRRNHLHFNSSTKNNVSHKKEVHKRELYRL